MKNNTSSVLTVGSALASVADAQADARGGSRPPCLIGGVNSHIPLSQLHGELGIDWLSGSFPSEYVDAVSLLLVRHFGTAEILDYGFYGYDKSYVYHPFEARLFYDSSDVRAIQRHNNRAVIQLPGSALSSISSHDLRDLIADLVLNYSFRCTRIDICFDDFDRVITPRQLAAVCEADNFTGYRVWEHKAPRKRGGVWLGDSVNFGLRGQSGSGKYLRVYDKDLQSDGEINSVRWEVEFSKEKALLVCSRLAFSESYDGWCALLGSLLGGSIDFVDRADKAEKNLPRLSRLDFWERIVNALGSFRIRSERPVKTVEGVDAWVKRSVASSLKMLRSAYGCDAFDEWLGNVLQDAVLSVRHSKIVYEFKRQSDGVPF